MKRTFAVIGFSFGITLFILNVFGAGFAKYAAVALLGLFLVVLAVPHYRKITALPVCTGTALFACAMFMCAYYTVALPQLELSGRYADVTLYLTSLGEKTASGYSYTARVIGMNIPNAPRDITIRLFSYDQIPAAGYQVIEGRVKYLPTAQNGFSSYGLWGKNVFLSARLNTYNVTDEHIASPIRRILEMRYNIINMYGTSVGGDAGALSAGLLVGDRSHMSSELKDAFKLAGASHMTAVSGLHLGAVTGFFAYIFRLCGVKRRVSAPILIVIIVFYCALSGFSKSVVRAGIMLTVVLVGTMLKRHADALNSLGFALFLICINPFAVCDIGTLLTTCSMLAIIVVYPIIEQKRVADIQLKKLNKPISKVLSYLLEMLLLSVAITLCCLPVTCVFFGYFSVVGVFLNVIMVPLGSLAVSLSLIGSFLSWIPVFPLAVKGVNTLVIKLIYLAAGSHFAVFNATDGFYILVAALMLIVGICAVISPKNIKKALVFSLVMITGAIVIISAYDYNCSHIYITESGAAAVCTKDKTVVLCTDSKTDFYELDTFLVSRKRSVDSIYTSKPEAASGFAEKYNCTDIKPEQDNYNYELDGVTFAVGNNSAGNIVLVKSHVFDSDGEHELSDGGVLYSVKDGSYYSTSF